MSFISVFQTLPPHVVQMIVNHVGGCSRLSFDGLGNDLKGRSELLMPLLWVCHNFRDIVYKRVCSHYSLHLDNDMDNTVAFWPGWSSRFTERDHASHHLVKRLTLKLDLQMILSGNAQDILSHTPFSDCIFLRARFIHFNIGWPQEDRQAVNNPAFVSDSEANICAFVQRVRRLVPMVNHISVSPQNVSLIQHKPDIRLFSSLASQLYQLASCIEYRSSGMNVPVLLRWQILHDLTHITYDSKVYTVDVLGRLIPVARQCAQTLQYLVVRGREFTDISGLIQDVNGDCVEYPNLLTLKLEQRKGTPTIRRPVSNGLVSFPNLRYLAIDDHYPFGDDIAFRGNSATLEHLSIKPRRETCEILRQFKVFTPSSHPRLQYVKVSELPDDAPNHFLSADSYTQFLFSIAPGAPVRNLAISEAVDDTFHGLDILQNHACIQVLVLPNTVLPLWFAVSLIKWLPLLSDLHCLSVYADPLTEDASLDEFHTYIQSLHSPENKRLRCWRLDRAISQYIEQIVICVVVVASICPNFNHIALPSISHNTFMSKLEVDIESGKYKQYEPHLRRLLFWK